MVRIHEQTSVTPPDDSQAPADAPQSAETQGAPKDRRRPGRRADVNPTLLPLLRRDRLLEDATQQQDDDDLEPVRGIGISVLIGTVLWGGIASLVYWLVAG